MSSMRPRSRNELRAYLEMNLSDGELVHVQEMAKTPISYYK